MEKNMIVQYVRDEQKQPFGVVVAIDKDKVGFALCNPKDRWNKERAKIIAKGRASKDTLDKLSMRLELVPKDKMETLDFVIKKVILRAISYYKCLN